jgi:Ca-activated chloride channel family protein
MEPMNPNSRSRRWFRTVGAAALTTSSLLGAGPNAESAYERFGKGDVVGARQEYEQLLTSRPDDHRLAFNAGVAAYRQQDWEGAARRYESALGSADLRLQQRAFFGLGNARFRLGEGAEEPTEKIRLWEDAVRQYQAALGLNPADTDARANLEAAQEALARERKEQQEQQKDPKQDKKDKQDKKKEEDSKDQEKQDSGKSDEQQAGKEDSKDSKQDSKEGSDSKDGKDQKQQGMGDRGSKKDPSNEKKDPKDSDTKSGDEDKSEEGQGGKPGDPREKGQKDAAGQGQGKGGDQKAGSGKEGGAGEKGSGSQAPEPGTGGAGGMASDAGEDSADGRMAIRFAERMLDGHKREERALILRPAAPAQDPRGGNGRRKTW